MDRNTIKILCIFLTILLSHSFCQAQQIITDWEKKYTATAAGSESRAQIAGRYAQALFFNQQTDKALHILKDNLNAAESFKDSKYAAYLSAILSMNYRIMDDIVQAKKYSRLATSYSLRSTDREIRGYVCYTIGWLHVRNGEENDAVKSFLEGLKWLEEAPVSETLYARKSSILTELASIYSDWKEFGLQEKYTTLALDVAIKQNEPSAIFSSYMLMGNMYEQHYINNTNEIKMRDLAEEYYNKAISFHQQHETSIPFGSNLSFAALNLANLYMRYYPETFKTKALYYANLAIAKAEETQHYTQIASAYGILAEIELRENNLANAKNYLLKSLSEIMKDPLADEKILMNINLNLSEIYETEGDLTKAIHYYKDYIQLFSSVYDTEKMEQGRRIEAQFEGERKEQHMVRLQLESEKKEQQIKLMQVLALQQKQELQNSKLNEDNQRKQLELADLEREKQTQELRLSRLESQQRAQDILNVQNQLSYKDKLNRNYSILAAVLFLFILALSYAYRERSKSMLQKEELHLLALEKERQNSKISTLTAMLDGQELERGRLARDLHDGLGGLLSGTKINLSQVVDRINVPAKKEVQESLDQLDIAVNELRRVAHNLMPDLLKKYGLEESLSDYAQRMSHATLDVSAQFLHYTGRLSEEQQLITYRIIQELVNNAVKHADSDQILIQLVEEENTIHLTVEDNGKGFDVPSTTEKKSAGLINIQSRVNFLKGNMQIQSSQELGTTVEIDFPFG
ncbi:ATP-binding protein [Sphingobacterium sp. LRF_L2]|uniref:ATP-binding protein n=1 Tax=Sphingobacterium sp. LRF_L2 TaxID=3369421 RepID=UPI003F5F05FA